MDREAWDAANPGLADGIKSLSYMEDAATRALTSPADQSLFRAYDLNAPLDPEREPICTPAEWEECIGEPERIGPCYVGLDIGGSASMTACAAFWPMTGAMTSFGAFGSVPGLIQRGNADGVGTRYVRMRDAGELRTYGLRVCDVGRFLVWVKSELRHSHVVAVGADRFRRSEVADWGDKAGVRWPIVWRGLGASAKADGSHDVRAFQSAVWNKNITHKRSLMAASAIAGSALRRDAQGNPALDKQKARARIDWLQAAVIACGLAAEDGVTKRTEGRRHFVIKSHSA